MKTIKQIKHIVACDLADRLAFEALVGALLPGGGKLMPLCSHKCPTQIPLKPGEQPACGRCFRPVLGRSGAHWYSQSGTLSALDFAQLEDPTQVALREKFPSLQAGGATIPESAIPFLLKGEALVVAHGYHLSVSTLDWLLKYRNQVMVFEDKLAGDSPRGRYARDLYRFWSMENGRRVDRGTYSVEQQQWVKPPLRINSWELKVNEPAMV